MTGRQRLITVLGTRPELVKLSPVVPLLDAMRAFDHVVIHTGQHYSAEMDAIFFRDLGLRPPDVALQVGSGPHGRQTGAILAGVEEVLLHGPATAGVVVLGDTNSTLGGALAAAKLAIPVVHIEAGCRSFQPDQPEEINRILVDHCAQHLLAPDERAAANLRREGVPETAIAVVGSTSIDAVLRHAPRARGRPIVAEVMQRLDVRTPMQMLLCTVHRAENTLPDTFAGLLRGLNRLAEHFPIVLPLHPRARAVLDQLGGPALVSPRVLLLPPLGYLDMLALLSVVRALLTDSGGLQEEAAAVGTPALVLRERTEWSYLVEAGRNALIGANGDTLCSRALALLTDEANAQMRAAPCRLNAGAAERIATEIECRLAGQDQREAKG
ncbi:MAG: UDP-N-acetylglucosamine 2-epimerase (non-hydrolyzing) [Myxococcales bacterium]|nr:UDP-N-acetylglucosamine 2-epimerase (non-hydrolyzing) [Myxococcales bacterium]